MNKLMVPDFFPATVAHGFYGRQGGVSKGIYSSLNCSYQSHDYAEHIDENRLRVLKDMGGKDIRTLKQIHSDICFPLENSCMTGAEEGDALVTKTAGQVIGCLTADCAPVLFYGEDKDGMPIIGVAHAGWGGALKGVLESTVNAMVNLGAVLPTIRAVIGPCLAQANYEVGEEFSVPFVNEDSQAKIFFAQSSTGKQKFDLQGYVEFRLRRAGVRTIFLSNKDTYSAEGDYFSYRRATHRGEPDYGRQISAIMINF